MAKLRIGVLYDFWWDEDEDPRVMTESLVQAKVPR